MAIDFQAEDEPGIHEWVTRTRVQMSSEERRDTSGHDRLSLAILPQRPGSHSRPSWTISRSTPLFEFRDGY